MAKIIKRHSYKVLAAMLLVSMFGFYIILVDNSAAEGAQISNRSDTLNNSGISNPSTTSNHEIAFTVQNTLWTNPDGASTTLAITFVDSPGFDLSNIKCSDIDLLWSPGGVDTNTSISEAAWNGNSRTARTNCPGSATTWGLLIDSAAKTVTLYTPTTTANYIVTGTKVIVRIGSNAVFQDAGTKQIINPTSAGSKSISIGGSFGGTGTILTYIISGVVVSATVGETLTFIITGLPGRNFSGSDPMGGCNSVATPDDDDGQTISLVTTTAATVPFGTISSNTTYQGCQRLAVGTNAANGYTISQREDTPLRTLGGASISDTKCDSGSCTPYVAGAFTTASLGLGVSCRDSATSATCSTANPNIAGGGSFVPFGAESLGFASSTRFSTTSVAPWVSTTEVHVKAKFRLRINAAQAAGNFTNNVTWIATPVF